MKTWPIIQQTRKRSGLRTTMRSNLDKKERCSLIREKAQPFSLRGALIQNQRGRILKTSGRLVSLAPHSSLAPLSYQDLASAAGWKVTGDAFAPKTIGLAEDRKPERSFNKEFRLVRTSPRIAVDSRLDRQLKRFPHCIQLRPRRH